VAQETRSTILIALISAVSAIIVAVITTYGTIAVSKPEAKKLKDELRMIDLEKISNLPIGTIAPSMLHPGLFARAVGDPSVFDPEKSKWVLADGQKDITNSQYGKLLVNTRFTPDLRGMFLRGLNEGRTDDRRDPDERQPGVYQSDALQEHEHETNAIGFKANVPDQNSSYKWGTGDLGFTSTGDADMIPAEVKSVKGQVGVAGETRPKNVAVYFYIKIN